MIEVSNISKSFEAVYALSDVSFKLSAGEITALVGENGAGKSTLMRIICGYLPATSGEVKIFGFNICTQRLQALRHIGYVPEISSLYGEMTVFDFLAWIAGLWNIQDYNSAILKAAKQMQIIDVLDKKTETLSKGFKKRVEIASALLHEPKLLILDEPTDGLDPNQKEDIRLFMKQYAKENIVLVSTHVLEDADAADRVLMLSKGKLIEDTSLSDFKKVSACKDIREAFRILSKKDKQ